MDRLSRIREREPVTAGSLPGIPPGNGFCAVGTRLRAYLPTTA